MTFLPHDVGGALFLFKLLPAAPFHPPVACYVAALGRETPRRREPSELLVSFIPGYLRHSIRRLMIQIDSPIDSRFDSIPSIRFDSFIRFRLHFKLSNKPLIHVRHLGRPGAD